MFGVVWAVGKSRQNQKNPPTLTGIRVLASRSADGWTQRKRERDSSQVVSAVQWKGRYGNWPIVSSISTEKGSVNTG